MYMQKWVDGCRVTASDWIYKDSNGELSIQKSVEGFAPGGRISEPQWERVIYCPRSEETNIKIRLHSIAENMIWRWNQFKYGKQYIYSKGE